MLNGLPRNWLGEPGIQASAKCRPYHLEKCQLNLERTALSGAVFDCRAVYFAVTLHNDGYQAKTRVRVFLCYREISVLPVVARRVGGQRRAFLGCWQGTLLSTFVDHGLASEGVCFTLRGHVGLTVAAW